MSSNLPDGVSINDIPGNRPIDIAWDNWLERVDYEEVSRALADQAFDPMPLSMQRRSIGPEGANLWEVFEAVVRSWLDSLDPEDVGFIGYALGCTPPPPE